MATWLFCCVTCPQKWIAALFPSHISQFHAWHLFNFKSLCLTTMWSLSSTILLLFFGRLDWQSVRSVRLHSRRNRRECNKLTAHCLQPFDVWRDAQTNVKDTPPALVIQYVDDMGVIVASLLKVERISRMQWSYWFCKCYKTSKCRASTHHKLRIQPNQAIGARGRWRLLKFCGDESRRGRCVAWSLSFDSNFTRQQYVKNSKDRETSWCIFL